MPSESPTINEEHARKAVIAHCEKRIEQINAANDRDRHTRNYGMIKSRRRKREALRSRILALATGGKL